MSNDLAAEDELLQVMYWLRGEGLAADVTTRDVERFTGTSGAALERAFTRLIERGFVAVVPGDAVSRFALTADGIREGGRRFADEFADLTRPGHGECNDPDCDCKRTGHVEDCRHRV